MTLYLFEGLQKGSKGPRVHWCTVGLLDTFRPGKIQGLYLKSCLLCHHFSTNLLGWLGFYRSSVSTWSLLSRYTPHRDGTSTTNLTTLIQGSGVVPVDRSGVFRSPSLDSVRVSFYTRSEILSDRRLRMSKSSVCSVCSHCL